MLTISFLGCGRAGQVLGYLWHHAGIFRIGQVLTGSADSAADAAERIGAGVSLHSARELLPADLYLVATPDQCIAEVARQLPDSDACVFHLAGALSSTVLREAGVTGPVASIHPAHSFGNFEHSIRNFRGTWCACEGDPAALKILEPAFRSIGGHPFPIPADRKLVYHAAGVMISNCLHALIADGLNAYQMSGLQRETATALVAQALPGVVENITAHGPAATLTGPIVRGDWQLVAQELEALRALSPELAEVYRLLGARTLELARTNTHRNRDHDARLRNLLASRDTPDGGSTESEHSQSNPV